MNTTINYEKESNLIYLTHYVEDENGFECALHYKGTIISLGSLPTFKEAVAKIYLLSKLLNIPLTRLTPTKDPTCSHELQLYFRD